MIPRPSEQKHRKARTQKDCRGSFPLVERRSSSSQKSLNKNRGLKRKGHANPVGVPLGVCCCETVTGT